MKFSHADLGELWLEDTDWNAESVRVPFASDPVGVSLADGSDTAPSDAALQGYEWIQGNWEGVLTLIEKQAFDFYAPYADAFTDVPEFDTPEDLMRTAIVRYLRVFDRADFEITLRFDWQVPDDEHEITFYVEDGRCETHSVDG